MPISKRDVLELRRRLTKKSCSFDRLSGCYVNGEKQILLRFNRSFTDLIEDEMFKYLDIAKKTLSGTLGNNLLELSFARDEKATEKQQFLWLVKSSKLENPDLLESFYEQVIKNCDIAGNFLILLFHDIYDVIARTKDRAKLDESEEVYEYIICAVCPVELSEAGLSYNEQTQNIGICQRDWIVKLPEIGFLYPAFADGSSDSNSVMYYMKNAKDSHPDFIENALNCTLIRTAAEQKSVFETTVKEIFGSDEQKAQDVFMQIQRNLNGYVETQEQAVIDENLTEEIVSDLIADIDIEDDIKEKIENSYISEFSKQPPTAKQLLDTKLAAEADRRAQTKALQNKVIELQNELAKQTETESAEQANDIEPLLDKLVSALPEINRSELKTKNIDGKQFLLIPLDNDN